LCLNITFFWGSETGESCRRVADGVQRDPARRVVSGCAAIVLRCLSLDANVDRQQRAGRPKILKIVRGFPATIALAILGEISGDVPKTFNPNGEFYESIKK
jgi:hypothetical protein